MPPPTRGCWNVNALLFMAFMPPTPCDKADAGTPPRGSGKAVFQRRVMKLWRSICRAAAPMFCIAREQGTIAGVETLFDLQPDDPA
ncbi:hypothetical protein BU26DRAFT_305552 [Trematosphaeria pertusa]|uniref:Uncharacterized protein n=1 Tax=Trematosphaeria pertusa TaxID=390896 RepID=A0A6A6IFU1_9PLEO|nr:uncharacterized protein BU26DRAFT_305552 [Trematosphaeria pertusa]KAF2248772.1 hypothetical protein BU26DRAFT_305552 [Trematosphaeria pertusa]